MLHKTKGIVLHTIKFTETSIITKIYTETFGLQSYIINGVRAVGAKNRASIFTPMNLLELEIYRRENKNLQRVREFRPAYIYKSIPLDVVKSSLALFLAELLYKTIREEECNSELFAFIEQSLLQLDEAEKTDGNFHLSFMLQLSAHLGFAPAKPAAGDSDYFDLREGKFTAQLPPHPQCIGKPYSAYLAMLIEEESPVALPLTDRNILLEKMLLYYTLHLHDFRQLTSHKVLHELFC